MSGVRASLPAPHFIGDYVIKKIAIVGGGFAGWYAATSLQHCLPNIDITIVDSQQHPQLGVGEATGFDAPMNFRRLVGLENDHEFMRKTGAIYKFGTEAVNLWKDNTTHYYNKFHNLKISSLTQFFNNFEWPEFCEPWAEKPGDVGTVHAWLALNSKSNKTYEDFLLETGEVSQFTSHPWAPYTDAIEGDGRFVLREADGWSYLFDAERTSAYFKEIALSRNQGNFTHISSPVQEVIVDDITGDAIGIILENQQRVDADLFIDCTGFNRVLVSKVNTSWEDAGDEFNHAAWAAPTGYTDPEKELSGATQFHGEDWGWRFRIRLYHRIGNGYVFNPKMVDPELIRDQFIKVLGGEQKLLADPRLIMWKPGQYRKPLQHKVISMGISCGLIDPFESPTFDLQSRAIENLVRMIKENDINENEYNHRYNVVSKERELRLQLTFGLSQRSGEWWESRRAIAKRDDCVEKLRQVIMRERLDLEKIMPFHWHHMYIRLCIINDVDTSGWDFKPLTDKDSKMVEAYFAYQKARNQYISESAWPNYYQWLKTHRFHNLSSNEILRELNPKLVK